LAARLKPRTSSLRQVIHRSPPKPIAGSRFARPLSLGDQIYAILRKRILTGEVPPGAIIDERAIAAEFEVSRTPVREAVKKLTDENLVEVKAQSRTLVKPINRKLIHEAFLIRRALEVENVSHAAERATKADIQRLEDVVMLHKLALQRRHFVEAIKLDDDFHRQIAEISDLPRLWKAIEVSKAHLDRCRYLTVPQPGFGDATLVQHHNIIKALARNDEAQSRRMMGDHLDKAYRGIVSFLDVMESELRANPSMVQEKGVDD